jgi:hypothetical protein
VGGCNPGQVVAFFTDYLAKPRARMSDQLGTLFNPWIGLFNEIRQAIGNLDQTLDRLAQLNQRLQRETKAFQQDHCQNITMCVDDVSTRFYNKGNHDYPSTWVILTYPGRSPTELRLPAAPGACERRWRY